MTKHCFFNVLYGSIASSRHGLTGLPDMSSSLHSTNKTAAADLIVTLYRESLKSARRVRQVMRPGHVVLVAQCVQRFADQSASPALQRAVKEHGPLPLAGLVRHAYASTGPGDLDSAFGAMRTLNSLQQWVNSNNKMYDSLEGISDREGPPEQPMGFVVKEIIREASPALRP